jgi:GH43 family beta-xylosidase
MAETDQESVGVMRNWMIASLLSMAASFAAADPLIVNPLVEQRADPCILRHTDGYYYFIATAPEYDRIELRRAAHLADLATAEAKVIWTKHETGEMGAHIWAPELHFIDGKWYVYFAAGEAEQVWRIRMFVLENASANPLEGEWIEKGRIVTANDTFSLDATTFEHLGKRYLVWAQESPDFGRNSSLFIAEMDTPWSIKGAEAVISDPEYLWETVRYKVNEGPAVLIRNGRIFITYSGSATDHNYCMGMLTADEGADPLNPASWHKSPLPVFMSSPPNSQFGPGHNSFTVSEDGATDLLVYHARNYKEIEGNPLRNPDRHTRVQPIRWRADGYPDFGEPVADGPLNLTAVTGGETATGAAAAAGIAPKPLYTDPIHDGAADPTVIWNRAEKKWFMFYTNRRANMDGGRGVEWVHGTPIGIAESSDGGVTWKYRQDAKINHGEAEITYWAPDVMEHDGTYHMFLTIVPGIFDNWRHPRDIVHLTSADLLNWDFVSTLKLSSERVIDADVVANPAGGWRMFYNNEADGKSIYYADSEDLTTWVDKGKAVHGSRGEGPAVFRWHDAWWMLVDAWKGLAVYRSTDLLNWELQETRLVETPGTGRQDGVMGNHPDVVVSGGRAYLFYFTHPGRTADSGRRDDATTRRSVIQVTGLRYEHGWLTCDRNAETAIDLVP